MCLTAEAQCTIPPMKSARLFTLLGSILLALSAIFHAVGFIPISRRIAAGPMESQLGSVLKAFWLTFSVLLIALALIAVLAQSMERGGTIVLLCAAGNAVTAGVSFYFLGLFVGVYLLAAVTVLFLIGGWFQFRSTSTIDRG